MQLTFVGGLSLAWVASYVLRVMNKDMTYVKQLKDYEDAVMAKRLEELPEAELEKMMDDIGSSIPSDTGARPIFRSTRSRISRMCKTTRA